MKTTAWKCSYCGLFFEGLLGSKTCPKCDTDEFVKTAASYPVIQERYNNYDEETKEDSKILARSVLDEEIRDYRIGVR